MAKTFNDKLGLIRKRSSRQKFGCQKNDQRRYDSLSQYNKYLLIPNKGEYRREQIGHTDTVNDQRDVIADKHRRNELFLMMIE